jgi:hypothetical protein
VPAGDDIEAGAGSRGSARPDRAVPPVLEPSRVVTPGRYHLPLEPVDVSALATPD